MYLKRERIEAVLLRSLGENAVTALLGPRQCGKTTLVRTLFEGRDDVSFLDLEDPRDANFLRRPISALESLDGIVVIDEVQRQPELFEVLRVLADRNGGTAATGQRFVILGSAAPELVKGVSESLAGRVWLLDMAGFSLDEVGADVWQKRWRRGGFPRAFLGRDDAASMRWRRDFVRTFLERDLPALGISIPAPTMRRFWTMVAHFHGQTWNAAEFARALGTVESTARRYLDLLSGAYMVRQLQPWFVNIKKRQRKAPKLYLRDTGLLHTLLELEDQRALLSSPRVGASWEGFCIEEIIAALGDDNVYYWAAHSGAEVDLLVTRGGRTFGFEFKYTDTPKTTRSMHTAIRDLGLTRLFVIYPGTRVIELAKQIEARPLSPLPDFSRD